MATLIQKKKQSKNLAIRGNIKNMNNINSNKKELSPEQREELLRALKARFEKNMNRHKGLEWAKLQAKLDPALAGEKLWSLNEMERTGGEPDVAGLDKKTTATAGQAGGTHFFFFFAGKTPRPRKIFFD